MADDLLFRKLLNISEKILSPLGIWPTASNSWISLFNIVTLTTYSILVLIKNLLNPERESIENAFTLANGGLITVIYFIILIAKKGECMDFFEFIKSERKSKYSLEEREVQLAIAKEYQRIATVFFYILPTAIFIKFIQPLVEYLYILLFNSDGIFELPPSMGIPVHIVGEYTAYILESMVRAQMLIALMGVCSIYILSTLFICLQFHYLAINVERNTDDDGRKMIGMIQEHGEILRMAKMLNEIFSPYFFADCCFSFINLSIMMFSLIASNANIKNMFTEIPLVSCGMSQLFFVLYFGDRLIDATSSIATAAWNSEWFGKSLSHQHKIRFMIMRSQKPQMMNVGNNFMVASIYLFSQICQRAWGAFNILRTTVKR